MAEAIIAVQVPGLCSVYVSPSFNTAGPAPNSTVYLAGTLYKLGFTMDGAELTFNRYMLDVPTDENAGESGPPSDVQFLGVTAMIRLQMTKFEPDLLQTLRLVISGNLGGAAAGAIPGDPGTGGGHIANWAEGAVGQLLLGNAMYWRLLLWAPSQIYNFPYAFPRDAETFNLGTKFQTDVLEFQALRNSVGGILYNEATT